MRAIGTLQEGAAKKKPAKKKGRCWKGYEPTPGKKAYSDGSCRPISEGKSPAWQRKEGKNPEGGLNAKGVASYKAKNPGSKLKTAVTTKPSKLKKGSKAAGRRASFCARMGGMKKKNTSSKTASDPESRINKSLRKWNCNESMFSILEKRKTPRNAAEKYYRDTDRQERAEKHGTQVAALNYYGGRNAPKGHARGSINALQRLNQKQDNKAGKENTRVRHVTNHIMMGIRDKDGQLTPKAAKTYVAQRKANLQRKREKREEENFNTSMNPKK